jgi:hypothetical protein
MAAPLDPTSTRLPGLSGRFSAACSQGSRLGHGRHFCAARDERLDQPEAKPAASAGDDDLFVVEAHRSAPVSGVHV